MKLRLFHKIIIALTASVMIFCCGFLVGYSKNKTTINITTSDVSAENSSAESLPSSALININTAGAEELELLPGIGPALSAAIIEYRNTNGDFNTIEDIMNVKGISLMVYRSIESLITV